MTLALLRAPHALPAAVAARRPSARCGPLSPVLGARCTVRTHSKSEEAEELVHLRTSTASDGTLMFEFGTPDELPPPPAPEPEPEPEPEAPPAPKKEEEKNVAEATEEEEVAPAPPVEEATEAPQEVPEDEAPAPPAEVPEEVPPAVEEEAPAPAAKASGEVAEKEEEEKVLAPEVAAEAAEEAAEEAALLSKEGLEGKTVAELKDLCRGLGITKYSKMRKAQLVERVYDAQRAALASA